jgi:S-formylglutathione hydrolase
MQCPWGHKAYTAYLGRDPECWKNYDPTELVSTYDGPHHHILIDQGTNDEFLAQQLLPTKLLSASTDTTVSVTLTMREGYDHSYYFIASFIDNHIAHHAKYLKG